MEALWSQFETFMGRPEEEGEEGSNGNGNSNGNSNGKRKVSGESDVPIKSEIKQEPEEGESTVMQ